MNDTANELANALTQISEIVSPVADSTQGYKAQAEARGFSPTVAEQMALDYHRVLIAMVGEQMINAARAAGKR